ncbi:hypothetical protein HK405_005148 [Cladochytrium tenue]|nr:hypothetical protein HK405_005148 [Cladochytrium tenue]
MSSAPPPPPSRRIQIPVPRSAASTAAATVHGASTGATAPQQEGQKESSSSSSNNNAPPGSKHQAAAPLDDDDPNENLRGASGTGYLWEDAYKRSWDVLQEDEDGTLTSAVAALSAQKRRRAQVRDTRPLHRGIIRHMYLVVDMSASMADTSTADHLRGGPAVGDAAGAAMVRGASAAAGPGITAAAPRAQGQALPPPSASPKLDAVLNAAEQFVEEFFDANPLGSLGVILTREGAAERLVEPAASAQEPVAALRRLHRVAETRGDASLQNALEAAAQFLLHAPGGGGGDGGVGDGSTRDVLVLFGSLNTSDPGDIFATVQRLSEARVRVSVVGLSAEVRVCRTVCERTGGTYNVVLSDAHLREVMSSHVPPPPEKVDGMQRLLNGNITNGDAGRSALGSMLVMGFPAQAMYDPPPLCALHRRPLGSGHTAPAVIPQRGTSSSSRGAASGTSATAYLCPRCNSAVCQLPVECPVCSLMLVSGTLLARSYHHLFPVGNFVELVHTGSEEGL